ncbi:MAG: TolC family protein [Acidobacteria bacterium]|nr:TolC family protein [Acidobacteriota bacterium]
MAADASGTPVAIDMANVVKLVRGRNLEVQASREGITTARRKVEQARALRLGKIGVEASYLRLDDRIAITSDPVHVPLFGGLTLAVPPVVLAPQDLVHVQLQAGLPLFTGGKISNTIAQARAGEKAAEALSGDTEAEVILRAERLYLGVLLSRDVVRLNEQALESYGKHLEQARSSHRLGVVAMYDVIRAETAAAEQEKRLTEARNRCQLVEAALRTALDLSETAGVDIGGTLVEPPPPMLLTDAQAAALTNHGGLEALRQKVEALQRAEKVEQGDYFPQIVAVAGKETVSSKMAQTDPNWFAGVRASWTLFQGGARRARVSEKASETARARIELRHAEEQIRLAVRSSLLDYESQKSAYASARKAAELAKESLRLATRRFGVGAGTSLEVLDANLAVTASQTGVRSSLYYMDMAYLEVHRHTGDIAEVASRMQR